MRSAALLTAIGAAVAAVTSLGVPAATADPYPSPDGGTRQVVGAILDDYRAVGGPSGPLGLPLTDELSTPAIAGRYSLFEHGAIYWTPGTGAHEVRGAIWEQWGSQGWENSFLGFPTTNELGTPAKYGRYNAFQRASIYWSPASGAHSIGGAIRDRWAALGWENSKLGFPVTNEFPIPGGRAQDFQCGSIRWSPGGGTVVVGCGTTTAPPANPGDTKDCTDFVTQAQAQAWFDLYYPLYGDVAKLDGDNDRRACESLP